MKYLIDNCGILHKWQQFCSKLHYYFNIRCFFHLPDLEDPRKTIFGISCYRQIDASKLINKTEDITRTTVQKSVCVLSRLPLYGHIQVGVGTNQRYFSLHFPGMSSEYNWLHLKTLLFRLKCS